MFLRPITRPSWRAPISISSSSYTSKTKRQYQSSQHLDNASPTSSIQTIPSCPSPTCACEPTPEMPPLLGIDYSKPLNGSMAAYAEQVLICTGKDDWPSKIEDDNSGDNLAADIKELVGRGGPYSDPYHNISTLNSSFRSTTPPHRTTEVQVLTTSAYLLPSFKYIPFLPRVSFDSVTALVRGYLLPKTLNPAHDNLSPIHRDRLIRSPDHQAYLYGVQDVKDIMILICGHGGRDARCGIYGPLLQSEFEKALPRSNISVLKGEVRIPELVDQGKLLEDSKSANEEAGNMKTARVGLISHIGGHKFAGNIIVYIPPGSKLSSTGENHPLAGCGIWYGRVEPKHVEGIVKETVVEGKVIADHFRGGIRQGGEILRL